MKRKNLSIAAVLCLTLIVSCTNDTIEELLPVAEEVEVEEEPVPISYATDVKPIMDNNCISCHGGQFPQAGLRLETYTQVRLGVEDRDVIGRMTNVNAPMPPSGLLIPESAFAGVVVQWQEDGFVEMIPE